MNSSARQTPRTPSTKDQRGIGEERSKSRNLHKPRRGASTMGWNFLQRCGDVHGNLGTLQNAP